MSKREIVYNLWKIDSTLWNWNGQISFMIKSSLWLTTKHFPIFRLLPLDWAECRTLYKFRIYSTQVYKIVRPLLFRISKYDNSMLFCIALHFKSKVAIILPFILYKYIEDVKDDGPFFDSKITLLLLFSHWYMHSAYVLKHQQKTAKLRLKMSSTFLLLFVFFQKKRMGINEYSSQRM